MSDRVTVEIVDGVADVRLNRPDKMNALDKAMFDALVETSESLAHDSSVRCVVLSGEGKAFCAGLDFGNFQAMAGDTPAQSEGSDDGVEISDIPLGNKGEPRITHHGQQAVYGWTDMPVPVIAAITGVALGGGIQLALGADIRVIAPDARMSVLEIRWGLVPDMTGTQRLVELCGIDVAKELVWTGRMVEGAEAVEIGLATKVSGNPHATAMALAKEIASKSPTAIRGSKRLLRNAAMMTEAEGFEMERTEIGALIGAPNQVEAIRAYFEKREPNYPEA